MDAAVAGLLGALVGAAGSVGAIWVQSHFLAKRERAKAAMEFATQNRAQDIQLELANNGIPNVAPAAAYVHHHRVMLDLLEGKSLAPEKLEQAFARNVRFSDRLKDLNSKWVTHGALDEAAKDKPE